MTPSLNIAYCTNDKSSYMKQYKSTYLFLAIEFGDSYVKMLFFYQNFKKKKGTKNASKK